MLAALLSLDLAIRTLAVQEGPPSKDHPGAEQVARVAASLDEALRSGEVRQIQAALETAQDAPHATVVRGVQRFLEDDRAEVKLAALQSLRWLEHPDAVGALHRATKDRKLMKVPELALAVLRGIGQHAHPSSIPFLAHDPFEPSDAACLRARIFGLARIRRLEALEALLGILAPVGPGGHRRIQARMEDVRLGLMILTGVDRGASPELWESWWRDNKKSFRVPLEAPPLPKELRQAWENFWGLPRVYEREGRREDRGQDPPPRKD